MSRWFYTQVSLTYTESYEYLQCQPVRWRAERRILAAKFAFEQRFLRVSAQTETATESSATDTHRAGLQRRSYTARKTGIK